MQKKSIGLKSKKKATLHVQHIFLHISLPLFFTTSTYLKLPICMFYGGKIVYVPTSGAWSCLHSIFFISLLLILTLQAANICHFSHSQLWIFHVFFFRNELSLLSLFFLFLFVFCSSSFSVIGVSIVVVGGNSRTHDHVITKFCRIYVRELR